MREQRDQKPPTYQHRTYRGRRAGEGSQPSVARGHFAPSIRPARRNDIRGFSQAYSRSEITWVATVECRASTSRYASKSISSVTYRLYHRTKKLLAAVLVAPNKHGECVKFDLQELYKGKWYDSLTGCGPLGANSTAGAIYTLSKADLGYHYRLRAEYQRGKDTTNLSADSGWQYFIVQK